ncbi:uncharacterized protein BJ171DRAFT_620771 [Polychytrium aggregatum]|uniref:uncharacterized protein n=1 Tax=Polychytrium aggregatum TaxID=110093 RepID=UPI0022FE7F41|nr:uncharacterized protein BJ171DRAFT_620771 [Polychytrium aggregatum]KAI9209375.1 hypothetical protein BJ171DRAFT_620771 [Polychytrium aggregatum]
MRSPVPTGCLWSLAIHLLLTLGVHGQDMARIGRLPTCMTYNGTACSAILSNSSYYAPIPQYQSLVDPVLLQNFSSPNFVALSSMDRTCATALMAGACRQGYLSCAPGGYPIPLCRSSCLQLQAVCNTTLSAVGMLSILPNCSAPVFASANCTSSSGQFMATDSSSNVTSTNGTAPPPSSGASCPPPLIVDPNPQSANPNCQYGCCLPCPKYKLFYPQGPIQAAEILYKTLFLLSLIGFLLVAVAVLVSKNGHKFPKCLTAYFSIAGVLMMSVTFGTYPYGITDATQSNNVRCLVTGTILLFSMWSLVLWAGLLLLSIHMIIVWNNRLLADHQKKVHVFCWGVSLSMTLAVVLTGKLEAYPGDIFAEGSSISSPGGNGDLSLFFGPHLGIVLLSILLHTATSVRILMATIQRRDLVKRGCILSEIKALWQPTLLAIVFIAVYIPFLYSRLVIIRPLFGLSASTPWVQNWLMCLIQNQPNGYQQCLPLATPNVPDIRLLIFMNVLCLGCGIWVAMIMLPGHGYRNISTAVTSLVSGATSSNPENHLIPPSPGVITDHPAAQAAGVRRSMSRHNSFTGIRSPGSARVSIDGTSSIQKDSSGSLVQP